MNDYKIIQLDQDISNKIAAGEVVERPLAVVKELVENAIDANANKITVEIKDAGKSLIRITDNGNGILPDDILIAFKRHSTSKIRTINDIYNISSLGFRGEALASIASVSNIEMISKHLDFEEGSRVLLSGGKILESNSVGAPQGTTIFVKDLFFNTPARLKFLKSNNAEQNAINDIMNKLAMSHPEISFKYIVNGQNVFMTPGNNKLYDVILNVFQRSVARNLMQVSHEENGIIVQGYISNIETTRGNKQLQISFVNNRYVKSQVINDAVTMAYRTLIPHNRFPICFMNVMIDPSLIDINIHPAKTEIRFHQEGSVKDLIYKAIKMELNKYNLVPSKLLEAKPIPNREVLKEYQKINSNTETITETEFKSTKEENLKAVEKLSTIKPPRVSKFTKDLDKEDHFREKAKVLMESYESIQKPIVKPLVREDVFVEQIYEPPKPLFEKEEATIYDDLNYIGQAFKTYLLYEKKGDLYLIDQHAAHEKILYEKYVDDYRNSNILSQLILEPITFDVNYMEKSQILHYASKFSKLGFQLEEFGDSTVIIREIPQIFDIRSASILIKDLIEKIDFTLPEEAFELSLDSLMQHSCKTAIKANQNLNELEVNSLINQLKKLKDPYTCPHGRPIIITIGKKEIEKKFNRT